MAGSDGGECEESGPPKEVEDTGTKCAKRTKFALPLAATGGSLTGILHFCGADTAQKALKSLKERELSVLALQEYHAKARRRNGFIMRQPEKIIEAEIVASLVTCHRCGTKNRLHQTTSVGRYRCGSCQAVIHEIRQRSRLTWLRHLSLRGWAVVVTCIVVLLLSAFTPWPHFQWATVCNSVGAYEAFVKRFPESDYVAAAKEQIRKLRDDEVWDKAVANGKCEAFKSYVKVYPDGKHLAEADGRIQEFYNDLNWVRTEGSLPDYQRFAGRFPNHPQIAWIEKRIIDLEVKEISSGQYGELPRSRALSSGGFSAEIEVENRTGYELTVRYSGPDSQKLVIPTGKTGAISIQPGDYKVAASVSAAHVTNYYGNETLGGGKYSSYFYIRSAFDSFSIPSYIPPVIR